MRPLSALNYPLSLHDALPIYQGKLGSINAAVDVCNVVSLHSGIPISVVDLDRLGQPLYITAPQDDAAYVFNATGQEITVTGIPCLFDARSEERRVGKECRSGWWTER